MLNLDETAREAMRRSRALRVWALNKTWVIVGSASNLLLALITAWYVWLTHEMLSQSNMQVVLSEEPVLRIMPEKQVANVTGRPGVFSLTLINAGISDVDEIEVYEDYFVAFKSATNAVQLVRCGGFTTMPNSRVGKLAKGQTTTFTIDYSPLIPQLIELIKSPVKAGRSEIARIRLEYRRAIDGKLFSMSKVYVMGGVGRVLFEENMRGMVEAFPEMVPFEEVRRMLGGQ